MSNRFAELNVQIGKKQMEMLNKLSEVSMKPKAVLVREAIELLFRSPGGKING